MKIKPMYESKATKNENRMNVEIVVSIRMET